MRAHQIKNNIVVNTIEVDSLDFMPGLIEATDGGIGWSYVDGIFVDSRPVDYENAPEPELTKRELLDEIKILMARIEALK